MRLRSTALVAVFTALLSCVDSASVSAASDTRTADFSLAKLRVLPGFATNRLLRASETNDKNNEDRVMNAAIEKLTGLVKTGAMKINGNVNWRFLLAGEQPADEILKMFKLENGMKRALASPNLKLMKNYVQEVNTINRNNKLSVIGIFTTHYGDDAVAKALVTMQSKVKTEEEANTIKQLRSDQLSAWLNSGKSVDDVFTLLKLRKNGHLALASPKMEALDDYMKLVIRAQSSQETLLHTLTKYFGGERKFVRLLVRAKENTRTKELAKVLERALLNKGLMGNVQPVSVFKKLRLDRYVRDALFEQNGSENTVRYCIALRELHNINDNTTENNNNYGAIIGSIFIKLFTLANWWVYLDQARDVPHILVHTEKCEHLKVRGEHTAPLRREDYLALREEMFHLFDVGGTSAANGLYAARSTWHLLDTPCWITWAE